MDLLKKESGVTIDASPLQIPEQTPVSEAHLSFILLSYPQVLVTSFGRLSGVLTKRRLVQALRGETLSGEGLMVGV